MFKIYKLFIFFQFSRYQIGLPESNHTLLKEVFFVKDPAVCITHRIYFEV